MRENIAKLIDVKSIITFVLTGVFAYLSFMGKISENQFMTVYILCVSFFFGTKIGKKEAEKNETTKDKATKEEARSEGSELNN